MAANTAPIFPNVLNIAMVQMTAANTGRDGTGTLYDLNTAGVNGSRVDKVVGKAAGNTAAGTIRLFLYDGVNNRLIDEQATAGVTASGTVPSESVVFDPATSSKFPLFVPPGWILRACTHNAETWNMVGVGGDY